MSQAIILKGGAGGVESDDVTAGKAQVLQGYRTITSDSDDEVVEGEIVSRGTFVTASEVVNAPFESTVHTRFEEGYYNKGGQYKPTAKIPYAVLSNVLGIDANKMLDTLQVSGVRGTIPVRGYHGPDSSEMWLYPQEGGYVVRLEEGYYHKGGQWKPYVIAPTALVKSAVNYHPEKTLSDTNTCGEQGQIKMVNTKDNNYAINQATLVGMDSGRGKLIMWLGHGNAYYYREDGHPHVEADASTFGTAGADSVLQGQTASSQQGINFQGTIPRWIATHGDVIIANSSHSGQGFTYDLPGVGRGVLVGIKNGAFIQGANYAFLPSPNLQPWNVRKNVNINGTIGTMEDYGAGRVAFRNATFDNILVSGVANKGFTLRDIPRFLNLKNSGSGYLGIRDGGMKFSNYYSGNTRHTSAPDVGCVLSQSIDLSPFRYIKVGFKFFRFIGVGTKSQPARIRFEVGVVPVSNAGGDSYNSLTSTPLRSLGYDTLYTHHIMESTNTNSEDKSDHSQLYLTLDVTSKSGQHFIYFLLGYVEHEYSLGSTGADMVVNYIEFIN